jgi:hypothetical protein
LQKIEGLNLPPDFLAASNGLEHCYPGTKLSQNKKRAPVTVDRSLGRVTVLKLLAADSLFFAFTFGMTAMAAAQAMPPPHPTGTC